jgi:beta-lactamase superfamily II metal-dependent hydrolase
MWITWAHVNNKLTREKVHWISMANRRGRPHAAPVWGIWKANRFYFETDPKSANGRNLSNNPSLVVHVQDGNDTVILEGSGRREKTSEKVESAKEGLREEVSVYARLVERSGSRSFSELNQGSSTPGKLPECTGV